jgi:hypothetical protein
MDGQGEGDLMLAQERKSAMELSREYHQIVIEARDAMRRSIATMMPDDGQTARQLLTIALVGAFADFISRSVARRDVLAVINDQLADVGLEVVEKPRQ